MTDADLISQSTIALETLSQPYALDIESARLWHSKLDTWLRNPDNDCLRARGDNRWITICTLDTEFSRLIRAY